MKTLNTIHPSTSAKPWGLVLALVGLQTVFIGAARAADAGACDRSLHRATRSVTAALGCAARSRRRGDDSSECVSRAVTALSSGVRRSQAVCADRPALAEDAEHCVTSILDAVPGTGHCAARKVAAVRAAFRATVRAWPATNTSGVLCQAFARAGECPGECEPVHAALATCAESLLDQPTVAGTLPPPESDDLVLAFGAYEGDAISTTTVVGQDGVTDTARVVIEPGTRRLYVVLSSFEATIWRFEGATSRVGTVVLVGYGAQGVTGIAPERVVDLSADASSDIPFWYEAGTAEGQAARAALEHALERELDHFVASYSVGIVTLPSMTVTASSPSPSPFDAPPGFDPWVYITALWFSPGGVVDVEPAAVAPLGRAEPYVVLPQAFGLAQLVAAGLLENRGGYFYIAQPIPRFPAGLHGAHSVSFVLGNGVPMPPGDPGHSCVVSQETGLPVDGTLCWNLPPVPPACTLPEALPEDQVVVFGAYQGDATATATVAGQDEETRTARIVVEPGVQSLYVILSAYDSMVWRFEGATSRVRQVVLVGVRLQGVTGIPADNPADLAQVVSSLPDARCFSPFYDVQSPEGVAARGSVERALGRPVDVIAGDYAVGTVSLPSAEVEATPTPADVPTGFDPSVYQIGLRFSPGGVVDVAPASVVPSGLAESYVVLPQAFGLAQLVATEDLELRGDSFDFPPTFYIARPIPRFPAGLFGAQAAFFVLGTGVPMPPGDPGHSCVVSEETGQPVANETLCAIWGG